MYPYQKLRTPNVLGTLEALKLASEHHIKPFHFVSSTSVLDTSHYVQEGEIRIVNNDGGVLEEDSLDGSRTGLHSGYGKHTKGLNGIRANRDSIVGIRPIEMGGRKVDYGGASTWLADHHHSSGLYSGRVAHWRHQCRRFHLASRQGLSSAGPGADHVERGQYVLGRLCGQHYGGGCLEGSRY